MAHEVLWAEDIDRDLELIFDFLAAAAESFGESNEDAFNRAMQRSAGNGRRKSRAKPAAEESSEKGESADSAESSDSDKPAEGGSESAPQ